MDSPRHLFLFAPSAPPSPPPLCHRFGCAASSAPCLRYDLVPFYSLRRPLDSSPLRATTSFLLFAPSAPRLIGFVFVVAVELGANVNCVVKMKQLGGWLRQITQKKD
jgi:hypothetical protein